MFSLPGYARAAAAGLAAFVAILLLLRVRSPRRSPGLPLLALVLLLTGVRVLVPWPRTAQALLGFALLWALHLQAEVRRGRRRGAGRWLGHAAFAAGAVSLAGAVLIGYWNTVPSRLLYGFVVTPLLVLLFIEHFDRRGGLAAGWRRRQAVVPRTSVYGAAVTALAVATSLETLLPGSTALSVTSASAGFLFLAACGYLLSTPSASAVLGRPEDSGPPGRPPPELRAARVRLAESERSLRALDRLAASSLIAAGTVHELKSSLSGILTSTQFALRRAPPGIVADALQRIAEHAREGELTVMRHLEPILCTGREEPRALDLERDLGELYRVLRVACRRSGVSLCVRVEPGLVVGARAGEVTQVLLSLARNALESLAAGVGGGEGGPGGAGAATRTGSGAVTGPGTVGRPGGRRDSPRLEIRAARGEGEVFVEVADNGRGIPAQQVGQLFERAASGTGSTGLGLYLSRMLAERNGGALEYVPAETGCCFRLTLPLAGPS